MSHLNDLHQKYSKQGLSVFAISSRDEFADVLQFVIEVGPLEYKTFIKTTADGNFPGGSTVPRSYIIDAEGKIVWNGHPDQISNNKIQNYLEQRHRYLKQRFQGAPQSAISKFLTGQTGKAYNLAIKAATTEKKEESKKASEELASFLEDLIRHRMIHAQQLFDKREYAQAKSIYLQLAADLKDTKFAKDIEERLTALKSPELKKEIQALEQVQTMLTSLLQGKGKKKQLLAISQALRVLSKQYTDTYAAEKASEIADICERMGK